MAAQPAPRVGQIVMYVEDDGRHSNPAIVTKVQDDGKVDLVFFQTHTMGEAAQARHDVPHSPPGEPSHPHNWHELEQS